MFPVRFLSVSLGIVLLVLGVIAPHLITREALAQSHVSTEWKRAKGAKTTGAPSTRVSPDQACRWMKGRLECHSQPRGRKSSQWAASGNPRVSTFMSVESVRHD